jgi:atypical dual specificity phosphatase
MTTTRVTTYVHIGGKPMGPRDVDSMHLLGIRSVVSLLMDDEQLVHPDQYRVQHFLRIPTPDFLGPSCRQVTEACRFIRDHLGAGVLVHCKSGKGRSAVVVVAYLILYHGMTCNEAHSFLSSRRTISAMKRGTGFRKQWRAIPGLLTREE